MSGKRIAELFEEALGLGKFDIVQDNIRIAEQQETQALASQARQNLAEEVAGRQQVLNEGAGQTQEAMLRGL